MDGGEGGELIASVWTPGTDTGELIERAHSGHGHGDGGQWPTAGSDQQPIGILIHPLCL